VVDSIQRVRGSVAPLAIEADTPPDPWELEKTPM
jgi:hypothetical protein